MKLIKNLFNLTDKSIFNNKEDVIVTEETAFMMDCILAVLCVKKCSLHEIHLEMFRCGVYITYPNLVKVLSFMQKEGFLDIPVNTSQQ